MSPRPSHATSERQRGNRLCEAPCAPLDWRLRFARTTAMCLIHAHDHWASDPFCPFPVIFHADAPCYFPWATTRPTGSCAKFPVPTGNIHSRKAKSSAANMCPCNEYQRALLGSCIGSDGHRHTLPQSQSALAEPVPGSTVPATQGRAAEDWAMQRGLANV